MRELAFLIWLEVMYCDMAELCEDTEQCRAFFLRDQQGVITFYRWAN